MRFALDEEQAMIAESARRVLSDNFGRDVVRQFAAEGQLDDRWRRLLGATGLIGLCAPPAVGGQGLGCVAALAIATHAGAQAVPFPLTTGIIAATALAALPDVAAAIMDGRSIVALADSAVAIAQHADQVALSARFGGIDWAAEADGLIVELVAGDGGRALYLVDMTTAQVRVTARKGIDLTVPVGDVDLVDARAVSLGAAPDGWHERRIVLAAAELEGAARTCLDLALDHMKSRRQFGQEIGRFQALKHIAANDALHIESMAVANAYAAWAIDAGAPDMAAAVAIAKSFASEAARIIAQDSIQCHGGIGFTWEYGLHFFLRRILRLAATLGTVHDQREHLFDIIAAGHTGDGE